MITVISPAKRLNETASPDVPGGIIDITAPLFLRKAQQLAKIMRQMSAADISSLMDISPDLGALNHTRYQDFPRDGGHYPAVYLFAGDTYTGLDARTFTPETLHWAHGHLRILSGLYGLLRPLDAIKPYRLEMGTGLHTPKGRTLYAFWAGQIARALNDVARETGSTALVNCASVEYFSAVDRKALRLPVITPLFVEEDNGHARTISFWAKQARGAMARYICAGQITDPRDLRGFDLGGYTYRADKSDGATLTFARPYLPAKGRQAA